MNDSIIYVLIVFFAFIAYKKYTQYKVLKLVPSLLKKGAQIVDVRSKEEFALAHKNGSINIPLDSLKSKVGQLDKNKPIIICCQSGGRSAMAKRILTSKGFKDIYNVGSWNSLTKF